ncbi:MAG: SurA N-terminal domain-containing protein [Candidatus Paracaedibacteraceae bacterium]|nr:SurA N-terminal domain-containing protein [Candidatus Paracaedibacteraceae bacterium]
MLQTFRKHSGSIFAKILFGLLVASFAFFGVGDMLHSYTAMQPVAKVGGISISQEEFLHSYQKIITRLQTVAKGKLKPDDIRNLGVEKRVIDDLVNNAVLDNEIRRLGLMVSNTALQDFIKSVPAFQNQQGQFDRNQFRYLLYNNEMSEAGFIQQSRESLLKQQLVGTLSSGIHLPSKYRRLIFDSQEQQKVFNVVYIPLATAKINAEPTDVDLDQLYQTQQELFVQPQYRTVSLLVVDPKKLQETIAVMPDQIKEEYINREAEFTTPELRDVTQLTFSSKENAQKAHTALVNGKSFASIAKEFKGDVRTYSAANKDKFSDEHSKAIFSLNNEGITDVLSSAFGATIFKVTQVFSPKIQRLEEVKGKIEADLKSQLYSAHMNELQNKIEDGLAGGTPLKELAQQYNLSEVTLAPINIGGLDKQGKSVISADLKDIVLENAFNQDEGIASSLINTPDGRSIAVLVTKITPKTLPPLSEIRDEVARTWRQSKQREAASKIAQDMVAAIKTPQDLTTQAKHYNLSVRTLQPISRVDLEEGKLIDDKVTPQSLRTAFALSTSQATAAPAKDGYVVAMPVKVLSIDTSKMKDKSDNFDKALKMMVQRDFQESYIRALKEANKPEIRQDVINNLLAR